MNVSAAQDGVGIELDDFGPLVPWTHQGAKSDLRLSSIRFTLAVYLLYCFSHSAKILNNSMRSGCIYIREFTPNPLNQFITNFEVGPDHLSSSRRSFYNELRRGAGMRIKEGAEFVTPLWAEH